MDTQIFVNIATSDLARSQEFYSALGCEINPDYTNEQAACVVWNPHVYFMVLTRDFFATFTEKELCDPKTAIQALFAMSCDSREEVDRMLETGLAAGGAETRPVQDLGFMYSRALEDPDGNILEFFRMDPSADAHGFDSHAGGDSTAHEVL